MRYHLFDELPFLLLLQEFLFLRAASLHNVFDIALAQGIQMCVLLRSLQFRAPLLLLRSALLFGSPLPIQNALLFEGRVLLKE
jgi:hypothetical protein